MFGQRLFRHLFVPALLVASLQPWLVPQAARSAALALVLLLSMLGIWMAEQLYPRIPEWNAKLLSGNRRGWLRLGRDCLYLFGVTQLTAFLIVHAEPLLTSAVAVGHIRTLWPSGAALPLRVLLAFFAIEFFSYWIHRVAHRSRVLWQFHSTHHFSTELNGLKSVRTHPVDNLLFYVGRTLPLLVLGAGPEELAAATYFGGILGILAHANIRVSDRWLGWVFNFPQVHAVHHSSNLAESNSNFGCHTVLWDRVFGTYRRAPLGLVPGVLPVGPRSLWQELAWPFFRWVTPR